MPRAKASTTEKAYAAWELSRNGMTQAEIQHTMGVSQSSVRQWLEEIKQQVVADRMAEGHDDLAVYLGEQQAIIDEGLRRIRVLNERNESLHIPQLLGEVGKASERKAKALGLVVARQKIDVQGALPLEVTISFDGAPTRHALPAPARALPDVIDVEPTTPEKARKT